MSKKRSKLSSSGTDLDDWEVNIIETLSLCEDINEPIKHYRDLKDLGESFKKDPDMLLLSDYFKALGNKQRFIILESLKEKDRCVCELEAILHKSQPVVSHHLKKLENAHLIKGWKKGKFTHFSLIKNSFKQIAEILSKLVKNSTNWFGEVI
jgi:ArsR family transcriptional regulator